MQTHNRGRGLRWCLAAVLAVSLLALGVPSASATTVIVSNDHRSVIIAADARLTIARGASVWLDSICKVHQESGLSWAAWGLSWHGGKAGGRTFDLHSTIRTVVAKAKRGGLGPALKRVDAAIVDGLTPVARDVPLPPDREIAGVVFVWVEKGTLRARLHFYRAVEQGANSSASLEVLEQNLEGGDGADACYGVERDHCNEVLWSLLLPFRGVPRAKAIELTMREMFARHPTEVGGIVSVLEVGRGGVTWHARSPECGPAK